MFRWRAFAVALTVTGLLASAGLVRAHADYDRSEPVADATVATAPSTVKIWFTQGVKSDPKSHIHVEGPAGQRVDNDDSKVDLNDPDRKLMTVTLKPNLPNGVYTVEWQTVSAEDDEEAEGEFSFTVGPAGAASAPAPKPTAAPHSDHSHGAPAPASAAPAAPVAAPAAPLSQQAPAQAPRALPRTGAAFPGLAGPLAALGGALTVVGLIAWRSRRSR